MPCHGSQFFFLLLLQWAAGRATQESFRRGSEATGSSSIQDRPMTSSPAHHPSQLLGHGVVVRVKFNGGVHLYLDSTVARGRASIREEKGTKMYMEGQVTRIWSMSRGGPHSSPLHH
ncbi:uncharacterized protein BDZ83DRAFT_610446 [Colletotrichum acutatum]|uniref:Secreted protein n=1 Tax=Glomerella acutata TaxID=27357 RepID=A0AAD8XJX5_GLOAC|nr:uncharacterized protein BDZ83DRAFT_610446 [Colletotrichum acutatum]KAK1728160.1 hypothetical protein BDZ83DRAFT_610446 [Colletotrichum acutatum]